MKISIIGAGNVGGLAALRLLEEDLGEITLVDIAPGLAQAKAFDLDDARGVLNINYDIRAGEDIKLIRDSDIIVVTCGFARRPGMAREELANKNAAILKEVCFNIKELASAAIVIIVTNPLDLMTYLALKKFGFDARRVFGMGPSLDASRFANLIAHDLNIPCVDIEAMVIGIHGEGMLPLARSSSIKGVSLAKFLKPDKINELTKRTVGRGAEIVALLGNGSAYFAPSAAIADIVKAIVRDEKRVICVSSYLNGEYGIKDACLGVPCSIGKAGIEKIIELELDQKEKDALVVCADSLKSQYSNLAV